MKYEGDNVELNNHSLQGSLLKAVVVLECEVKKIVTVELVVGKVEFMIQTLLTGKPLFPLPSTLCLEALKAHVSFKKLLCNLAW